jgi:hypothetical protein
MVIALAWLSSGSVLLMLRISFNRPMRRKPATKTMLVKMAYQEMFWAPGMFSALNRGMGLCTQAKPPKRLPTIKVEAILKK